MFDLKNYIGRLGAYWDAPLPHRRLIPSARQWNGPQTLLRVDRSHAAVFYLQDGGRRL